MSKLGYRQSEIHRRRISLSERGKFVSDETRKKLSDSHRGKQIGEKNPNWGKHHSDDAKKRISESKKGKPLTEAHRAKIIEILKNRKNPMIGRHHSKETKLRWSRNRKGKQIGSANPNWLGGISFLPYSPQFNERLKESIRHRDNYQCQMPGCFNRQQTKGFPVHHIDYNKQYSSPHNLITLCPSCHSKTNYGGRLGWMILFQEQLKMRRKIYD